MRLDQFEPSDLILTRELVDLPMWRGIIDLIDSEVWFLIWEVVDHQVKLRIHRATGDLIHLGIEDAIR